MSTPYDISDRAIDLLNRKAIRRFREAQRKAALLKFDELNVIRIVTDLYDALEKDNQQAFLNLAVMVYNGAKPHGKKKPDISWLLALLDEYDSVTLYQYSKEVPRKRERAIESIIAATNKGKEFQKALRYWAKMSNEYCDLVTDAATLKAYKDAGVKRVRWVTEEDEKVCGLCRPRDGKVYDIDKAPPKEHWGCRCYYLSAKE